MSASLRELKERNRSVKATQKITRAMELIAASRITKAQATARATVPYTQALNDAAAAVAAHTDFKHPLTREREMRSGRSAMLVVTSDRGLAGPYTTNVIKTAERLRQTLLSEGREVETYVVGRKGIAYYTYRKRKLTNQWEGFSDKSTFEDADPIATELLDRFMAEPEDGGVDEIHVVYTRFESMLVQEARARRVFPLEVVRNGGSNGPTALYTIEPSPYEVLNTLLNLYARHRIHYYLMQAAASELASKQRAMKAATDNAQELIGSLTRQANQARQAKITQEITEIVGGASALAEDEE
ncbi:MAG: F0F1 ATP synthase subunit gamma [Propionibacteriaceae bacterium]|jgi:F-type H+-transporting ATPase subunit gamma|nr:F0F1 ATP synthase subunit gamma [Propionibacteriaceae bacterium]